MQNAPPLICMSLNDNSFYCIVTPWKNAAIIQNMQLEKMDIQSQHMNLVNTATESCILGHQIHILGVLLEGMKIITV